MELWFNLFIFLFPFSHTTQFSFWVDFQNLLWNLLRCHSPYMVYSLSSFLYNWDNCRIHCSFLALIMVDDRFEMALIYSYDSLKLAGMKRFWEKKNFRGFLLEYNLNNIVLNPRILNKILLWPDLWFSRLFFWAGRQLCRISAKIQNDRQNSKITDKQTFLRFVWNFFIYSPF